jgi:agmatine/peptidylarginine deiminase
VKYITVPVITNDNKLRNGDHLNFLICENTPVIPNVDDITDNVVSVYAPLAAQESSPDKKNHGSTAPKIVNINNQPNSNAFILCFV